jgi:hypothetical protein
MDSRISTSSALWRLWVIPLGVTIACSSGGDGAEPSADSPDAAGRPGADASQPQEPQQPQDAQPADAVSAGDAQAGDANTADARATDASVSDASSKDASSKDASSKDASSTDANAADAPTGPCPGVTFRVHVVHVRAPKSANNVVVVSLGSTGQTVIVTVNGCRMEVPAASVGAFTYEGGQDGGDMVTNNTSVNETIYVCGQYPGGHNTVIGGSGLNLVGLSGDYNTFTAQPCSQNNVKENCFDTSTLNSTPPGYPCTQTTDAINGNVGQISNGYDWNYGLYHKCY